MVEWSASHTSESPLLMAMLKQTGRTVTRPAMVAKVLESLLQAYFCDSDDNGDGDEDVLAAGGGGGGGVDVWAEVSSEISLPMDGSRVREMLDHCVKEGHCLLLYAYLRIKLPKCVNVKEENVVLNSIIDWMRHLKMK